MRIRSIRLSLTVYFLALLAAALGVASVIVYHSAQKTLEDKQRAAAQLIDAEYENLRKTEEDKLDRDLLAQAETLAGVARPRLDWKKQGDRTVAYSRISLLAAAATPNPYMLAASCMDQKHWQFFADLSAKIAGQITFEDTGVLAQVSKTDYYIQINSVHGASYRSESMGDNVFPVPRDAFAHAPSAEPTDASAADRIDTPLWSFSEFDLHGGERVRLVTYKGFVPYAYTSQPNRSGSGPRHGDERPPWMRPEFQPLHAIYIQCAASTKDRDLALAGHDRDHAAALAALPAETGASLAELRNRLLLTGGFLFLAAVVGCYGLVRLGLAPLRRLSDAVSRVSAKDFRLQVDQRQMPGELKPIVGRLTQTLEMLKRAFEREKQATADISHELRTPLAALLTTTEIALRKPRTAEEYRELLEDCRLSAQHMAQAVERLLALARLDAGVDRLRPQPIDAADLAEQCGALVRPLAEARGLTLTVRRNGPAPVVADPDKLREIVTNLLHNAVEYNRPHGAIDLTVARENGGLEVEVKDTGVGIGAEAKAHLFERFYRADSSRAGDGLHAGLGLAIVKGYVDLMGGEIAVESVEGQGSTFRVRLPAH